MRQDLRAFRFRAAPLQGGSKALKNAVLKCRDDRLMHVALAAYRRRVGKLLGGGAPCFQYLGAARRALVAGTTRANASNTAADASNCR